VDAVNGPVGVNVEIDVHGFYPVSSSRHGELVVFRNNFFTGIPYSVLMHFGTRKRLPVRMNRGSHDTGKPLPSHLPAGFFSWMGGFTAGGGARPGMVRESAPWFFRKSDTIDLAQSLYNCFENIDLMRRSDPGKPGHCRAGKVSCSFVQATPIFGNHIQLLRHSVNRKNIFINPMYIENKLKNYIIGMLFYILLNMSMQVTRYSVCGDPIVGHCRASCMKRLIVTRRNIQGRQTRGTGREKNR
jgi:hypothetical protein